ncbi:hypothetical protein XM38_028580 [Halomicronema hongdechloris C2206]|uniref:Restriction endonuclease domain-containing protein n=1 Tax=Halomicronema hongdechloris C2206 TaxID=1641165 RepID=A0A1Z3HNL9_9CYAN|nr:hypothetical protein XM38_028580 [Halomicronema hongdechloris C2206]
MLWTLKSTHDISRALGRLVRTTRHFTLAEDLACKDNSDRRHELVNMDMLPPALVIEVVKQDTGQS